MTKMISFQQEINNLKNGKKHSHPINNGCWLCGTLSNLQHDHHIFPQAYGGIDSPRVFLCDSCHGAIHKAADKEIFSEQCVSLNISPSTWNHYNFHRADHLIKSIVDAKLIIQEILPREWTKNKRTKVVVELDRNEMYKLEYFKRIYGMKSNSKTLKFILQKAT